MQPEKTVGPASDTRELTYGEKAVGLTFNPSNHPTVEEVKVLYAKIIDICNSALNTGGEMYPETIRLYKIAITEAQTAQMWAVKAITWKN